MTCSDAGWSVGALGGDHPMAAGMPPEGDDASSKPAAPRCVPTLAGRMTKLKRRSLPSAARQRQAWFILRRCAAKRAEHKKAPGDAGAGPSVEFSEDRNHHASNYQEREDDAVYTALHRKRDLVLGLLGHLGLQLGEGFGQGVDNNIRRLGGEARLFDRVPGRGVAAGWSPAFSGRVGLLRANLKDTIDDRRDDEPALAC